MSDNVAEGLEGHSTGRRHRSGRGSIGDRAGVARDAGDDGRTAALVTPDRSLARRVAAELSRWEIAIDDSAGRPLAHTGAGAFLCLLAEAAEAGFAPVPLLALLKHPFASLGGDPAHFRALARALDRLALRGPRPDPGLAGIARRIAQAGAEARNKDDRETCARLAAWWQKVSADSGAAGASFRAGRTEAGRSDRGPSGSGAEPVLRGRARLPASGATRMAKPRRSSSMNSAMRQKACRRSIRTPIRACCARWR